MHNSFLAFLCLCFCTVLKGQALYGTSGLLHMPTADMQKDKTVMLGGNVLDKHPLSTYWNNKNYTYTYVSIRPRACFSPSYNKVKSQTKHVWLLTLL